MALDLVGGLRGRSTAKCTRNRGADAKSENVAARWTVHVRDPALAAFSASHHHRVGKAEAPYFGSGSGRL